MSTARALLSCARLLLGAARFAAEDGVYRVRAWRRQRRLVHIADRVMREEQERREGLARIVRESVTEDRGPDVVLHALHVTSGAQAIGATQIRPERSS